LLIDRQRLGALFLGQLRVELDPYGANFQKNLSDVRRELHCLFHVRSPQGAYRVAAA
jgi:hypothetical protein